MGTLRSALIVRFLGATIVATLATAGVAYFGWIIPLEKGLFLERAQLLGRTIEASVNTRKVAVDFAAATLDPENLQPEGGLGQAAGRLKEVFPDFLSLEILDDEGKILAMLGDVSLEEAGRAGDVAHAKAGTRRGSGSSVTQSTDSSAGSFTVSVTHASAQGGPWSARARFNRQVLDDALGSIGPECAAQLVTGPGSDVPGAAGNPSKWAVQAGSGSGETRPVVVSSRWWNGNMEVLVNCGVPGWSVAVQRTPKGLPFRMLAAAAGILALALLAAGRGRVVDLGRRARYAFSHARDAWATARSVPASASEAPARTGEPPLHPEVKPAIEGLGEKQEKPIETSPAQLPDLLELEWNEPEPVAERGGQSFAAASRTASTPAL